MGAAFKVRLDDGSEMGPLDPGMVRSWYQQGLINRESKVRPTGKKQWVRLVDVFDIEDWGPAGGDTRRADEDGAEEEFEEPAGPQTWRTYAASALFFLGAVGAGYFVLHPDQWLPALRQAPWREIALGFVLFGLLLVRGWEPMRKVARVLIFLLTFSLFALAAPVLMEHGLHWRALGVLACAWVMGSGLFFFLAGRALPWTSVAMCLFWVLAGAAGVGVLGFVPPDGGGAATTAPAAAPAPGAPAAVPGSTGGAGAARAADPTVATLTREMPLLSPKAAEVVLARVEVPEEAFKRTYQLAATGVAALAPPEVKELRDITTATYAPLPPPQRRRLDSYMERIRGNQVTLPQEDREISALVREAVLKLPDSERLRLQALYEKALTSRR
jgi:hypothetical protein